MKFTAAAALTTLFATAASAVSTIQLRTQVAKDDTLYGLSSIHEGAALEYFFTGSGSTNLTYDSASGYIYVPSEAYGGVAFNYSLTVSEGTDSFPFLELTPKDQDVYWYIDENCALQGIKNGAVLNFYAGFNASDPYRYSDQGSYAIGAATNIADYNITKVESFQPITIWVETE